jgi:long-chain fatty acid transport protein
MIRSKMRATTLLGSVGLFCAGFADGATAGAFQLREGSAAAQGMSLAGRSNYTRDVSFVLGNPANLRGVEGLEVTGGIAAVLAVTEGTLSAPPAVPGDRTGKPGTLGFVPSFALGYRVNEQFVLGVTLDSPFGLVTSYESDWAGAPDGIDSELLTAAITPMVSFQPIPELALAGGLTIQYADAKLSNTTLGGEAKISGDDIALGFIIGAAWDPFPGTSFGIRYRSGIDHTLEGEFSDNYILPGAGSLAGPGSARTSLPGSLNFGFTQSITDDWRVMAEAEFTDWSVNKDIVITSESTGVVIVDEQNYKDSWMFGVGGEYDYSHRLTLRAGLGFDQTPTTDAWRTTRVPDEDRLWFSAGFSWEVSDRFGVDAGYTFIHVPDDAKVTLRNVPGTATYESQVHVLGLNGRYRF